MEFVKLGPGSFWLGGVRAKDGDDMPNGKGKKPGAGQNGHSPGFHGDVLALLGEGTYTKQEPGPGGSSV